MFAEMYLAVTLGATQRTLGLPEDLPSSYISKEHHLIQMVMLEPWRLQHEHHAVHGVYQHKLQNYDILQQLPKVQVRYT